MSAAARASAPSWWQLGCSDLCSERGHHGPSHYAAGYADGRAEAAAALRPRRVRTGPLEVDLAVRTVALHGRSVHLSGREYELLAYLAEHAGRWRETDEIVAGVWGEPELRVRRTARAHNVNVVACRLRHRLGDAARLVEGRKLGLIAHRRLRIEEETP